MEEWLPCQFPDGINEDVVQLLIHPLSYAADLTSDYDVLSYFIWLKLEYLIEYNAQANLNLRREKNLKQQILSDYLKPSL